MQLNDDAEKHPNKDVLDNLGLVDFGMPTPIYRDITNIITDVISLYTNSGDSREYKRNIGMSIGILVSYCQVMTSN